MKMKSRTLKQLLLYNYRYFFAYVVIAAFIVYFLGWRLGSVGPGLAQAELNTAARHTSMSNLFNMPLYPLQGFLQWMSMKLMGVSVLSIRLPSVFLAFGVSICLYNLLKRWFGKSTALLCTALFLSADWFLFIARLGVGSIEFSLWLVIALLCFTKLLEHKTNWLVLFTIALVGLLFSPFGIYAAITLVASLFGCRVFKERFLESSKLIKLVCYGIIIVATGVIGFVSFKNTEFIKSIFGIQTQVTLTEYFKNLFINTSAVGVVFPSANPVISPTGVFFVRFFELIFILFGISMLWKTRINRLNLTVLVLSVVLVLVSGLSAGSRGGSIILVPAAIYITAGVRHLMHRWKRTFPKNPYARVVAYIPLGVLFICTVGVHYTSYFVVWPSQTTTHTAFSRDLGLLQHELNRPSYKNKNCLVQGADPATQTLLGASRTVCTAVFPENKIAASVLIARPGTTVQGLSSRPLVSEVKGDSQRWVVFATN